MKITRLEFPDLPKYAIKRFTAERLGRTVVLAGRNGAGKSRILQRIHAWDREKILSQVLAPTRWQLTHLEWASHFLQGPRKKGLPDLSKRGWWNDAHAWKWIISNPNAVTLHNSSAPGRSPFGPASAEGLSRTCQEEMYAVDFDSDARPQILYFTPTDLAVEDSWNIGPADRKKLALDAEDAGIQHLPKSAVAYIQCLQNAYREGSHHESASPAAERDGIKERYQSLDNAIHTLLGARLGRDGEGQATLFSLPLGDAKLSDGQRVLLQLAVALHAQSGKLSEQILLLDEPENHLHPSALIEVIQRLQAVLTNGQLWVATHSVPLLATFNPDDLWYVEDGVMSHSGSKPRRVLEGLLGNEERIYQLADFLGLPAALAANHFAQQCLLPPEVLTTGADDPQTLQISRVLQSLRQQRGAEKPLKLLDYGAGRGRLASALSSIPGVADLVDYRAYDVTPEHRAECESAIATLHTDPAARCLIGPKALNNKLPDHSVDIVIMCNVLHEIEPRHWLTIVGPEGQATRVLKPDGFFLLVEDTEMRVGELAHANGFLVLETAALRTLFAITEEDTSFATDDAKGDGRLIASLVPAACLTRATEDTVKAALQKVKRGAMDEIRSLREQAQKKAPTYAEGRRHAFYVQQLSNSLLALQ